MTATDIASAEAVRPARADRLAFSIDEAAAALGLSTTAVRTLLATDRLGYTTAGSRVLIGRNHIEAFLDSPPERSINRPGYSLHRRRRNGKT